MATSSRRVYSETERNMVLKNFDLEVADRLRTWRAHLADVLGSFSVQQEGQIVGVPRQIRELTMGELASKYGGDVQKALRAVHHQHLQAMNDPAVTESPRKRKYLEEVDGAGMPAESSRASKTARTATATPKKKHPFPGVGTPTTRTRPPTHLKTPGTVRSSVRRTFTTQAHSQAMQPPPSPSPHKHNNNRTSTLPRPASPSKPPWGGANGIGTAAPAHNVHSRRPPSSATFDPAIPANLPKLRMPRKGETLLSMNGSPVANPLNFPQPPSGPSIPAPVLGLEQSLAHGQGQGHQRMSSYTQPTTTTNAKSRPGQGHSRTASRDVVPALDPSRSHHGHGASSSLGSTSTDADGSRPVTPLTPPPPGQHGQPGHPAMLSIPLKSGTTVAIDPTRLDAAGGKDLIASLGLDEDEQAELKGVVNMLRAAITKWTI